MHTLAATTDTLLVDNDNDAPDVAATYQAALTGAGKLRDLGPREGPGAVGELRVGAQERRVVHPPPGSPAGTAPPSRSAAGSPAGARRRSPRARRRSTRTRARRGAAGAGRSPCGAPRRGSAARAASPGRAAPAAPAPRDPGRNTSSSRFASAITASRGRSADAPDRLQRRRQLPLAAVDHDEVRPRRKRLVVPLRVARVAQPREAAAHRLGDRGEVVLALHPRACRTFGSARASAGRRRRPPSTPRSRAPGCSRRRSTRSATAATRG